jgi:NAD+ kinase
MRQNGLADFERRYVSDYVRAKETASHLRLEGPDWYVDPALREREWGSLDGLSWEEREEQIKQDAHVRLKDPFYWVPPNGESIAQLTVRLRILLDTLHRECSDMRVIVVCHGEVMWALRFMIERMSVGTWMELEHSDDPGVKIYNCQILHYTRRDPESGAVLPHLDWMRSLCPCQPENHGPGWQLIERETFSNEDLLLEVQKSSHLFE